MRDGAVLWALAGAILGGGVIALASIGLFLVPVALLVVVVLAARRVRGAPYALVAAGATFALAWASLVLGPNAPDDSWWPIACGLAVAAAGVVVAGSTRRRRGADDGADRPAPTFRG